jgi:hypothetical protein
MKRTTILLLPLLCFCLAFSCCRWLGVRGNGKMKTEQREITDFSELQAGGTFEIEWQSGPPSLTLTTDENLLPYVESEVRDNQLHLHLRERVLPTKGLKVVVSSSHRTGSKLTGASELIAHQLTGDSYALQTTGAAEIKLDGTVDHLLADMTGASELAAKSLQVRTAEISTTGAASADVSVSESLKVTITGAGEVVYHGNPAVQKHVTGAGEVRRKD